MEHQLFNTEPFDTSAEAHVRIIGGLHPGIRSCYRLVAEHGRNWTPALKPEHVGFDPLGMCFQNALHLAHASGYTYVEGYATNYVPIHHAWCVDFAGNVIDPTWRELGCSYFGIPFDTEYVVRTALATRLYSVLWNHRNRELFDLDPAQYLNKDLQLTAPRPFDNAVKSAII